MRSCVYCGKELAPGEKCDCPASVARRQAADAQKADEAKKEPPKNEPKKHHKEKKHKEDKNGYTGCEYNDPNRTQYRTGYTRDDNSFKRAYKQYRAQQRTQNSAGFFRGLLRVLTAPVEAIQNPQTRPLPLMFLIWAVQGGVIELCFFSILTNAPRGPFAILGSLLMFRGVNGYRVLLNMVMHIFAGALRGMVFFAVYSGIFYLINRFIFRDRLNGYKSMCERLVMTGLPLAFVALLGVLLSFIAPVTLIIMLMCGLAGFVLLSYEAMCAQWVNLPSGKALYGYLLGIFVLLTVVINFTILFIK